MKIRQYGSSLADRRKIAGYTQNYLRIIWLGRRKPEKNIRPESPTTELGTSKCRRGIFMLCISLVNMA
jgi:hypothetical protein